MSPVIFSSGGANELEGAQVVEEPAHALDRVLGRHVVGGRDLAHDLFERLALLKPAPDERARLVQLEILLRVEIDEDALARVEFRKDNVLVRQQTGRAHQVNLIPFRSFNYTACRTGRERAGAATPPACHGILPKL